MATAAPPPPCSRAGGNLEPQTLRSITLGTVWAE